MSLDAMSRANLQAVDRVVKIVRELDRYHGSAAAERLGLPDAPRPEVPEEADRKVMAELVDRIRQMTLEEIAHGNAAAPETLRPRDPAPQRDGALASALDPADASPVRRQIAPQRLEKIESGPVNCMAPEASDPQDVVGALASLLDPADQTPLVVETSLAGRQMAPQRLENIKSAPGNGMAPEARDPPDMVQRRDGALAKAFDPAGQTPLAVETPPAGPEMAPQKLENMESPSGNGIAPEGSSPQDMAPAGCEPLVSPTAANPSGARRVNLRMTLNGVVAC